MNSHTANWNMLLEREMRYADIDFIAQQFDWDTKMLNAIAHMIEEREASE